MPDTRPAIIVRLGLYAALAAIPFELPHRQTLPLEVPTLVGALFLATALLQPRRCFGRLPAALWWFLAYLCVFALATSLNFFNDVGEVVHVFLILLQNVLVFWAAANLLEDDAVVSGALRTFGYACLLRAALPILGIGRTARVVWTGGERLTAFGQNENVAAMILAGGLITLLGIGYARTRVLVRPRVLVLPLCSLIAFAVVETGSRGGLVALMVGLATFVLARGQSPWIRIRNGAAALCGLALIVAAAYQTPVMRNRLRATAESGAMAGREDLYPLLAQMVVEKPVIGWGPLNNRYELSLREGYHLSQRATHNLLLETLSATGLAGTVVFCAGIWLCVQAAWRGRAGPEGVLPLALLASVLTANMSGDWMASKLLWLALAYAVASARRSGARAIQATGQDGQSPTRRAVV